MTTVDIHFLPDDVTTTAKVGESWLTVASRAGVHIATGCLSGACHACEIEVDGEEESVLACLQVVPNSAETIEVNLLDDPTW